ncbi:Os08g0353375 [Oryza sativa Japonica Group]|uniref:Os08g0353375 protein n=2 Tax=Oryza sativa subsp. japonica TaxID=39947 RepID=A3BSB1_ORYSJ|nr:hypothetical protein OsJ_27022 [Oryza sativa Japonica Group]BAT05066.1 Os08g0353375 [Oryza sativa Japonica Group]
MSPLHVGPLAAVVSSVSPAVTTSATLPDVPDVLTPAVESVAMAAPAATSLPGAPSPAASSLGLAALVTPACFSPTALPSAPVVSPLASPLCAVRRVLLLSGGISVSSGEPAGFFFDELDALAAEVEVVPLPSRMSLSSIGGLAAVAGVVLPSLPDDGASPMRSTGSPSLAARRSPMASVSPPRPEVTVVSAPLPLSPCLTPVAGLVDEVPNGVLFDVPMVVLDLDGWPMAHVLPSSIVDNAALRAFLTSCSRPLPPALLPPPPPPLSPRPSRWYPSVASGLRPRSRSPTRATRSLVRSAT